MKRLLNCALLLFLTSVSYAERGSYPVIPRLSSSDPLFRQYSEDVETGRRFLAQDQGTGVPPLLFYSYRAVEGDTLIGITARCAVPYDAIATLNRIPNVSEPIAGKLLILPTLTGLYLPDRAESDIEYLIASQLSSNEESFGEGILITVRDPLPRTVRCMPDILLDGTVRAFFLTPSFRFPLPKGVVTSTFGYRKNPVTGNLVFHKGIDLAAPAGTSVLACEDGVVSVSDYDRVYGNYIVIRHDGGKESLYGHLATKKIELQSRVKSGSIIGTVGSTGQSTGPHLHFEIRENGTPKNPEGFIKGKRLTR
jgi:hypothetical protein